MFWGNSRKRSPQFQSSATSAPTIDCCFVNGEKRRANKEQEEGRKI
jgi:hypothetical protein